MRIGKPIISFTAALLLLGAGVVFFVHTPWTDRLNPLIPTTTSYATVPRDTQTYTNVKLYTRAGKPLPDTLGRVGGFDATRQFIQIHHKGQYVQRIRYIAQLPYPAAH
ncbi:YxeA family protein [Lacticaseibacillus daqingensis]|uniref:hypothetical protein n=1 Tax=Lacticaseibacillus daqingensis TaxID=2486014 RepID=UPI000F7B58DC|nr:hypothetical protein [Lacticaseibacillus daqingensis]